ncbi:hypothetical protein COTS27_01053 [Spirochaetota bacterium]|nr:hypothetical protein COTS27_01053 [Spirochaetota bacterium]
MQSLLDHYGRQGVFVIAEGGTSHLGEKHYATELIHAASEAGAAAIKFQLVFADEILHPCSGVLTLGGKKVNLYQRFKSLEREMIFYEDLQRCAKEYEILFLASAFGRRSFNILEQLNTAAHKIASPELNFYDLWRLFLRSERPIFFSTGMSQHSDVNHLIDFLTRYAYSSKQRQLAHSSAYKSTHRDEVSLPLLTCPKELRSRLVMLQCVTCYPSNLQDYNLLTLHTLSTATGILTGLSDHTVHPTALPVLANWLTLLSASIHPGGYNEVYTLLGNKTPKAGKKVVASNYFSARLAPFVLEKHFTLNQAGNGLDDKMAVTSAQLKGLIDLLIRMRECFMGAVETDARLAEYRDFVIAASRLKHEDLLTATSLGRFKEVFKTLLYWGETVGLTEGITTVRTGKKTSIGEHEPYYCDNATLERILGTGFKKLALCEQRYYKTTRRSLIATRTIDKDEGIGAHNSAFLRAEQGNKAGVTPDWIENEAKKHSAAELREVQSSFDMGSYFANDTIVSGEAITSSKLRFQGLKVGL